MVHSFRAGLLVIPVALSLSGCLALSFGGKTIEATTTCTDETRLSSLEARVQTLEQRLGPTLPPAAGTVEPQAPAN